MSPIPIRMVHKAFFDTAYDDSVHHFMVKAITALKLNLHWDASQ